MAVEQMAKYNTYWPELPIGNKLFGIELCSDLEDMHEDCPSSIE
jgi:hypothetical protein